MSVEASAPPEQPAVDGDASLASTSANDVTAWQMRSRRSNDRAQFREYLAVVERDSPTPPDGMATSQRLKDAASRRRMKQAQQSSPVKQPTPKRAASSSSNADPQDCYCWHCHELCVAPTALDCSSCARTFHMECDKAVRAAGEVDDEPDEARWTCFVCQYVAAPTDGSQCIAFGRYLQVSRAELRDRSYTVERLSAMLIFALQRMRHPDSDPFAYPVPKAECPDYHAVIFHPVDLTTLETKARKRVYKTTEEFLRDSEWILHNSVVFNGNSRKLTGDARLIVKICRHEMTEIELCPDCYMNSSVRKPDWFIQTCTYPHCLAWAKLRGFPYWPAKVLRYAKGMVDCRFFGAYDRAWIPQNHVFLLSRESPHPIKNVKKYRDYDAALDELQRHCQEIKKAFGEFHYASPNTPLNPDTDLLNCPALFGSSMPVRPSIATHSASPVFDCSSEAFTERSRRQIRRSSSQNDRSTSGRPQSSCSNVSSSAPSSRIGHDIQSESGAAVEAADNKGQSVVNGVFTLTALTADLKPASGCATPDGGLLDKVRPTEENISSLDRLSQSLGLDSTPADPVVIEAVDSGDAESAVAVVTLLPKGSRENESRALEITEEQRCASSTLVPATNGIAGRSRSPTPAPSVPKRLKLDSCIQRLAETAKTQPATAATVDVPAKKPVISVVTVAAPSSSTNTSAVASSRAQLLDSAEVKSLVDEQVAALSANLRHALFNVVAVCSKQGVREPKTADRDDRESQPTSSKSEARSTDDRAAISRLSKETVRLRYVHQHATSELRHATRAAMAEARGVFEVERKGAMEKLRRDMLEQQERAVVDAKNKQWCAQCGKEAVFYCCWNTSYCDYPCQQRHWPRHMESCAQIRSGSSQASPATSSLKQQLLGGACSDAQEICRRH